MGLWLSGLAKADINDYDGAIRVWKKLQTQFQPGQEDYSEIQNLIDTAVARKSGKSDPVAKAEPKTTAKDSDEIMVKVDIDAAIKSKLEPTDTVFVYVKALEGPKMPLAVAKHQVKDLPLQIKFDDSMAMMPNLKLSLFDKVIVTARVSKQGNAIPQPGEPIGSAELVKPKSKSVAVKINSFN
jgi:cytochrome c-type biogenesis protein CcmH